MRHRGWGSAGEGTAASPQTQQPPGDSRFASPAASALCCTLKANSSFKKCGEQEYPAVAVLGRVIYSVAEQRRRGIPALPGEASASPRNKQEMLQHWSGRNRAPGQGCSSRIALKQPKEPALCIKEYAGNFTSALLVQVHLRVGDK